MTLDANIVIGYLNGDHAIVHTLTEWRRAGITLFLSTVAEAEVLSFSQWTAAERKITEQFLEENFTSISFDRTLARIAANLRSRARVKFPDAAIAATALATHTSLVTRNVADFARLEGVEIVTI